MNKKDLSAPKLSLARETLRQLDENSLEKVGGGALCLTDCKSCTSDNLR